MAQVNMLDKKYIKKFKKEICHLCKMTSAY